jgi:hypothetical protein
MSRRALFNVFALSLVIIAPAPVRADTDLAKTIASMIVGGVIAQAENRAAPQRAVPAQARADVSVGPYAGPTFRGYDQQTRMAIQRALQRRGHYGRAIDGLWGRGTALALVQYALATGQRGNLDSHEGSHVMMFDLIGRTALE